MLIRMRFLAVSVASSLLAGCGRTSEQTMAVAALERTAEQCLSDVRDRGVRYEASQSCTALGALSQAYIEAGGFQDGSPPTTELQYERARKTAWMARAISEAGGRPLSIW